MRRLLDTELLSGPHEVSTLLRPTRYAHPVPSGNVDAVLQQIERICQLWGGAGQPLIPVQDGIMPALYSRLLQVEAIDYVTDGIEVVTPHRVARTPTDGISVLFVAGAQDRSDWRRPVQVVDVAEDDPWRPTYAALLGTLPAAPSPGHLRANFLAEHLSFEEFFPVQRVHAEGSLHDLLARLESSDHISPRQLSNMCLAAGMQPDTSFLGFGASDASIPRPFPVRRAAGPNIIVALAPGSVEDVALLWNLRAAHGDRRVLPIGLPTSAFTPSQLRLLQQPGRATMFGFGGGACHITSASLGTGELKELAAGVHALVVAEAADLLTFGPAPGRPGSQVAHWDAGAARLAPVSDTDREVIRHIESAHTEPLVIDVRVRDNPLPTDGTMRGSFFGYRYRGGAAQVGWSNLRDGDTVDVRWPPTWTSLAAVAQSRGLEVKPSEAGLAAVTLLESLGGIESVRWLLHHPLIGLLYRLGERSGMAWWRQKWTQAHRELLALGVEQAVLEEAAIKLGRDEPAIAPSGEGRDLPFADFRKALGHAGAAASWVQWAERKHLLVRGAKVTCPASGGHSWLPMASLPPPVGCSSCGREIDQPFGAGELAFSYHLGEPLRRVLQTDSLGHVLALRWCTGLFDKALVGSHPGVIVTDPTTGKDIGEADVLLLFTNGDLVPLEVKRRAAGVDARAAGLLDTLSDALDAPWDIFAVTQPARDCPDLAAHQRTPPGRTRVLLTDDQLHEEHVCWKLGVDPFAWSPRSADDDTERDAAFVQRVKDFDLDLPADHVSPFLLNRAIDQ